MAQVEEKGSRGWVGWLQVGMVVLALAIGIYYARAPQLADFDTGSAVRSSEAPTVAVVRPVPGSHALTLTLTGEVQPRNVINLRPEASGRVLDVSPSLRAGGRFGARETLVVIEATDVELQLESVRGALDEARGRMRKHQEEGALKAAEYSRAHPGQPVPDIVAHLPQIERFRGRVRSAEAAVKLAERQVAQTRFSLPFAATVIVGSVSVGDLAGPAMSLGRVYRDGDLEVRVPIPLNELTYLGDGDARGRTAQIWAGGAPLDAEITAVSAVLAPDTRVSMLFLGFSDSVAVEEMPTPGTFVRATIRGPEFENAYLLPDQAHRADDGVWVVDGGALKRVFPRSLGRTEEGWIVAAFDAREGLVVGALPDEREGIAVRAVDAGAGGPGDGR